MIYFARRVVGGPIKIGIRRRSEIESDDRGEEIDPGFSMLALMDGGDDEERALLRRFSHLKIGGGWLRPGADLLKFIASQGTRDEGAGRPEEVGTTFRLSFD